MNRLEKHHEQDPNREDALSKESSRSARGPAAPDNRFAQEVPTSPDAADRGVIRDTKAFVDALRLP